MKLPRTSAEAFDHYRAMRAEGVARMTTTTEAAIPITEDMIEAGCRAFLAVAHRNIDADIQIPDGTGRTIAVWQSYCRLIEPALKAALAAARQEGGEHG